MRPYTPIQAEQQRDGILPVAPHAHSIFAGMVPVLVPSRLGLCITLMLAVNAGTMWYRWRSMTEYIEAAGVLPPMMLLGLTMISAKLIIHGLRIVVISCLGYRVTREVSLAGGTYSYVEPGMSPAHQIILFLLPVTTICLSGLWLLHLRPAPWIVFAGYSLLMSACSFGISDLSRLLVLRRILSRLQGPPWPHIAWIPQEHYRTLQQQGQLP